MKSADALLTAWEGTLARKGDTPAIFGRNGDTLRTFKEVEARAREFARKIDNFQPGEVLGVQIGNHEDWPSIFIGCLRKQIVVLPLEQSIRNQERDAALTICGASSVIVAGPDGMVDILPLRTAAPTDWRSDPPALLKLTSGTTAAPRSIRFHSKQLLADCEQICDTMGITDTDLNFGVIPISHSYGFSNLLTPLIVRGVPLVLSRDRLPRAVLDALARTGASVFPGMPVFYQAFCEMETIPDLPKLRLCISAGAPLQPAIAEKFRQKFGLSIHSFYGASECGGICYDRAGTKLAEGLVGQPMKNVDVELIDPGAPSSQIRVRSAAVGDAYFPEREDAKLGAGVFVPDDLVARDLESFRIVGRVSDVINVAGKKVNPAEVEGYLLTLRGVRQAVVFGRESHLRNEEVAACVVAETNVNENALLEFCRANLSAWQIPKRIFIVDTLPVNERGKISRRELARQFSR
jgi:acyl-CoA synthetase (AMP-forming)/AMP-acid ligase II